MHSLLVPLPLFVSQMHKIESSQSFAALPISKIPACLSLDFEIRNHVIAPK
jgi:hypothetical protein